MTDETLEARLRASETECQSMRNRLVELEKLNALLLSKLRTVERLAHSLAKELQWHP